MGTILTEGGLLAGRYQLGPLLGAGGMGEVRAGRDLRLGREVAVKVLRADLAARSEVRRRFEGEGRAAARLCHPNVVTVYDVGEHDGVPYLVMERVQGPSLAQELARGPMEPARVRRLGAGILAALEAAHAAGIVHRDIKPGNVLLTAGGAAKVTDFGIAKAVGEDTTTAGGVDLTEVGKLVGTVAYMAPERLAGEPATVAADLYAAGVLLHEALTRRRPSPGGPPLGEQRPDLDPALVAVVERALALRPEHRFATAAEMAAALAGAESFATPMVVTSSAVSRPPAGSSTGAFTEEADVSTAVLPVQAPAPSAARRSWRRTSPVLVAGVLLGGVLALAGAAGLLGEERASAPPPAATQPTATAPVLPPSLDGALDGLERTLR